ncbi:MAG TPA: N-acetylglucosamine-6-phosphate deacetylase [Lachnospiraceae bacterium]|uniref:N-acetylglucosamine-6-phosphate deacetylase n=1 Tax=Anaerosporobacter sp. TaxID=1872529 RepID=UPI000ED26C4A|nr:N-acetylglucosamine-6-phosphate deacetylase [Anaerosporobacter sp.]HAB62113.1 N-acetylglucosamine-6-phosphate deacetylase [Lachnospiraceae bacterium]
MKFKNGKVFTPEGTFEQKDLYVIGNKIASEQEFDEKETDQVVDVTDCYVIPGLIDIHFHGCKKVDFCDGTKEVFETIAEYQASQGVTAICPATMTFSREKLESIFQKVREYPNEKGAILCGVNMEGPYISYKKKGAQNGQYIRVASVEEFNKLQELSGNMIRLVDIAPEIDGAMEFIQEAKKSTNISIAHTTAGYDIAMKAFEQGASHVTHLYNAMTGFTHREPGVVGAAAEYEDCYVELICDGVHIHPSAVKSTFKLFGKERIVLISDSMEATGMPDGEYELGGQKVIVRGNRAELEDGTLAGSVTNLLKCMQTAVKDMGIPLEDAVLCATQNAAKSIDVFDTMGSLEPDKLANILILDKDLNIKAVYIKGERYL